MLRADWQKRRLQCVEGDLYRSIIAESSNSTLIAALLSDSPAAKLLARVHRQIAAFERTGIAPTLNSAAPAAMPKPTRTTPSNATSTA